jgi:hypothetical protein
LRAPDSYLESEGIIDFQDDIRARGTIVILVIEEVVVDHQVEVRANFLETVKSVVSAQGMPKSEGYL